MTQSEVEAFLMVARWGSISAAAERLFVTQPALSRRLQAMEAEMDCKLFLRERGTRGVALTEAGQAFLPVAEKLLRAYREAAAISVRGRRPVLRLASIGSVSTYLLPPVVRRFLELGTCGLSFQSLHSAEAYTAMEEGSADLALISDHRYSRSVRTVPLWREPFVLLGGPAGEGPVSPEELDPAREVRLPWDPEFDAWHDRWFDVSVPPRVYLDQMSLMESSLEGDSWAAVPLTVARGLRRGTPAVRLLSDGPAERTVYCLKREGRRSEAAEMFLDLLRETLGNTEGVRLAR